MSTVRSSPSASYAAEVARLLWPEPWDTPYVTRSQHRRELPHRDAWIFPSERRPRLLVPIDVPGSSSMLQRLGTGRSAPVGVLRVLLERSVRSRAFSLARWPILRVSGADADADSIERYLAECFGTQVRVGVLLGTRRANQKPVLQIFDLQGRLLGFAKVGHNDLTAALVRREAESLAMISALRPRSFQVPELVHHGQWTGLEVLVMSALTTDPRQRVTTIMRIAAMREVALLAGTTESSLVGSGFWARLRNGAEQLANQPRGPRLLAATEAIERNFGEHRVDFGGWHGDWGHWNMGMGEGVLKLWDWERFDIEVPLGFDGVHYAAQCVQPGERAARSHEQGFLDAAPRTLSALEVRPARHALTLYLYLLEMAVRYDDALTHGHLASLERRAEWVLSLLERRLVDSNPFSSKGQP